MRREILADGVECWLGDCREVDMPSGIECAVTSPPYNQMADAAKGNSLGMWGKRDAGLGFVEAWRRHGYDDGIDEAEYQREQNTLFSSLALRCTSTAPLFYNHQIRWRDGVCLHPVDWFRPQAWRLRPEIVWDRGGGMMHNARMFCRFDERILWFVRSDKWKWNQDCTGLGTVVFGKYYNHPFRLQSARRRAPLAREPESGPGRDSDSLSAHRRISAIAAALSS